MIKKGILVLTLFTYILSANAQKVYDTHNEWNADVKVFVVHTESRADLIVYTTDKDYRANDNKGKWFFVNKPYRADKKICFVNKESRADLKVFFTNTESRAGWKNPGKKSLME